MRFISRRALVTSIGLACAVSLGMSSTAHAGVISDFEGDEIGSTTPAGWTVVNQRVDLGVTELGGCVSQDTANYATTHLRDWEGQVTSGKGTENNQASRTDFTDGYAEPWHFYVAGTQNLEANQATVGGRYVWNVRYAGSEDESPFPEGLYVGPASFTTIGELTYWRNLSSSDKAAFITAIFDDPTVRKDNTTFATETYATEVVDGSLLGTFEGDADVIDLTRDGKVLALSSDTDGPSGWAGYVGHGPAVVSDVFDSSFGRELRLWWAASGAEDDFHVFGYLLNVDTCEQTEVLDATGLASGWSEAIAQVPETGTYRFVFVSGTFDQSFGNLAGGRLWIDAVVEGPSTLPATGIGTSVALTSALLMAAGTLLLISRRALV